MNKVRILFLICLLCRAMAGLATMVEPEMVRCPLCGSHYAGIALLSWNSWMNPKGPPRSSEICPRCLYGWYDSAPNQSSSQVPLIADSLRYLHGEIALPQTIKKALGASDWNTLSDIAIAACHNRSDPEAAAILHRRLLGKPDSSADNSLAAYYKRFGTDLPALESYARRAWPSRRGDAPDWHGFSRHTLEGAVRIIRLKSLLP